MALYYNPKLSTPVPTPQKSSGNMVSNALNSVTQPILGGGSSGGRGASGSWETSMPSYATQAPVIGTSTLGPALPAPINSGTQRVGGGGSSKTTEQNVSQYIAQSTPIQNQPVNTTTVGGGAPTIGSSGGGEQQKLVLPGNTGTVNVNGIDTTKLAGNMAGYYKLSADGKSFEPVKEETTDDVVKKYSDLWDKIGIKPSVYEDQQVIGARNERQRIQKALLAPTSELNAVIAKQNQDLLHLRDVGAREGVTEAVYGQQSNAINYNAAIRALPLQASIASLQGDLKLAQDYLSELTQIKQEQINNQYEYNKGLITAIAGAIEKKDQRAYEELKTANERAFQTNRDREKLKEDWAVRASENGQGNLIPRIQSLNPSSQTFFDDLGKITSGIVDKNVSLDTQYKKIQIDNAILQGQKLKSEITSNQPITGEYASVINGAAGLVANVKKQQVKDNIATALSSGNFVNAYAEIANAVSDGLTGTPKTKFDDARTDIGILTNMKTAVQNYVDGGGDMGLLTGTEESIKRKLGIDSGKASALATQLWREFQTYRSNMTGAAFTPTESRDYASVNPTLGKSLDLNLSVIDGALSQLENRITSTVNARIPDAEKIYNLAKGINTSSVKDGDTKEWNGVIYKAINGVWTPQ